MFFFLHKFFIHDWWNYLNSGTIHNYLKEGSEGEEFFLIYPLVLFRLKKKKKNFGIPCHVFLQHKEQVLCRNGIFIMEWLFPENR